MNSRKLIKNFNSTTIRIVSNRFLSRKYQHGKCNYKILGVKPTATLNEIKNAYYQKSKQYHPDLNKDVDAEKKFLEINLAYEILSNEYSRNDYDKSRGYQSRNSENFSTTTTTNQYRSTTTQNFDTLYTRNIYRRLKRKEFEYNSRIKSTKQEQYRNKTWQQRMEEEEAFYQSLDDHLKRKYDEYYQRMEQEHQQQQQQQQQQYEQQENVQTVSESKVIILITLGMFLFFLNAGVDTSLISKKEQQQPSHKIKNE